MSKGAVLIARNNSSVDYVKQAIFCAEKIQQHLQIPVTLITDNLAYYEKKYSDKKVFDQVIEIPSKANYTQKSYKDGLYARRTLEFKNTSRCDVYDLTPYDETILMDTDVVINNDVLKHCFNENNDIMMYRKAFELSGWRNLSEFRTISPNSIDFYWATVVFFRKGPVANTFFDLIKHIQENYQHYRNLYQITSGVFRNDFAFSIAAHIMNGHRKGNFVVELPGKLFYCTDKDLLHKIDDTTCRLFVEREDSDGYFPAVTKDANLHVINKFSLNRYIDESS